MVVAGAVAIAASGGTFAAFSASTTNAGSTFATGTLVLSNQKDDATACLSTGGGTSTDTNANAGCDQLFSTAVAKPGDTATVNVTLGNAGSLDASALTAFANAACAASDAPGQSYKGTGDPCGAIAVYVQEFGDSARTTPTACHYGGGDGTACDYDAAKTLSTFSSSHANAGAALGLGAHEAGAARHFTIGLQMNSSATNAVQGRAATFGFTWQLAQ